MRITQLLQSYVLEKDQKSKKRLSMSSVCCYFAPLISFKIQRLTYIYFLGQWGIQLAGENRFEDVALCYKRSLDIYQNNPRMLNNFAAHLLR